ncbi:MAG TPA: DnaJ domain-containing protein [Rickettsiales bacterium]|nr:DnaJ domain-containing protein [Rickettsiales bacterium]
MRAKTKEKKDTDNQRQCAVEGCGEPGEYKAPKSRHSIDEYQYLCLKHIREFNQAWDYFAGWSRKEIEDFMDAAAHGHKPTWSIEERLGGANAFLATEKLRESFFNMFHEQPAAKHSYHPAVPRKLREALATLDLEADATLVTIKSQYKKLVKKHHPDVNKGDKASEEMFKRITSAYKVLMETYGKQDEK